MQERLVSDPHHLDSMTGDDHEKMGRLLLKAVKPSWPALPIELAEEIQKAISEKNFLMKVEEKDS